MRHGHYDATVLDDEVTSDWGDDPPVADDAEPGDAAGIRALIAASGLPTEGVEGAFHHAGVVRDENGRVIGCALITPYGTSGLLRSVAVHPDHRGAGIGDRLVAWALATAIVEDLATLYLVTTDADRYFERAGFVPVARQDVDPAVLEDVELTTACPAEATVMRVDAARLAGAVFDLVHVVTALMDDHREDVVALLATADRALPARYIGVVSRLDDRITGCCIVELDGPRAIISAPVLGGAGVGAPPLVGTLVEAAVARARHEGIADVTADPTIATSLLAAAGFTPTAGGFSFDLTDIDLDEAEGDGDDDGFGRLFSVSDVDPDDFDTALLDDEEDQFDLGGWWVVPVEADHEADVASLASTLGVDIGRVSLDGLGSVALLELDDESDAVIGYIAITVEAATAVATVEALLLDPSAGDPDVPVALLHDAIELALDRGAAELRLGTRVGAQVLGSFGFVGDADGVYRLLTG